MKKKITRYVTVEIKPKKKSTESKKERLMDYIRKSESISKFNKSECLNRLTI